eukprot:TRINITY_DN4489_c0_g3_i1.p1 TRINITY_DN4489_c0_g3~~TRINITY_DN4489_c0_g3_i1.p1  ORF type:complete len:538 (-),score=122.25 TRINITY_DN4489_c0_g3_i1:129-1742(-)
MLKSIDQALAGAIDFVADDLTATVKSVRDHGVRRTLADAVEDAATIVSGGAKNVLGGLGGPKPAPNVSTHSGFSGGYADICAGGGSGAGGEARFQYDGPSGGGGSNYGGQRFGERPAPPAGDFHASIGIRRPGAGIAPGFAGVASCPPQSQTVASAALAGVAASSAHSTGTASSTAKAPQLEQDVVAQRFAAMKARDPANAACFDCRAPNPEWASVSFGCLVCITCSGYHRQMGTHISRIRSCKMDTWTEQSIGIFEHGGNKRLADFFAANGLSAEQRFGRYHTPAAEWYREAWIKSRTLGREVPPPPSGVSAGHCGGAAASVAGGPSLATSAPPIDLLDFGGADASVSKAPSASAPPAPTADLLDFGDAAPAAAAAAPAPAAALDADLLGVGGIASSSASGAACASASASTSLLGLDDCLSAPMTSSPWPAASSASGNHLTSAPPAALLGDSASLLSLEPCLAGAASTSAAAVHSLAPAAPAAPTAAANGSRSVTSAGAALPAARTMAGGARLEAAPVAVEKDENPFAMALEKWGM